MTDAAATGSASTGVSPSPDAMRKATAASPPSRSSAPPGRPVRMSDITASVGRPASIAARSAPAAERIEPSMSKAITDSSRASAAWMAVALVLSR